MAIHRRQKRRQMTFSLPYHILDPDGGTPENMFIRIRFWYATISHFAFLLADLLLHRDQEMINR